MSRQWQWSILQRLADGKTHSGTSLAEFAGVSRAAINKEMQAWREQGVDVSAVTGKGYKLMQPLQLLDGADCQPKNSDLPDCALEILQTVDSTNSYLLQSEPPAIGRAKACMAEVQTAGRGRRGRQWQSPLGANIYLSVAWTFADLPMDVAAISLAVAAKLAESLQTELGASAEIALKWPNDIWLNRRKLGGILLESRSTGLTGQVLVVVGVGLNYHMPAVAAEAIDQPWADWHEVKPDYQRNALACVALESILAALQQFQQQGFPALRALWQRHDGLFGQTVHLHNCQQASAGIAQGIDAQGCLLVDTDAGQLRLSSGEVSLRAA